MRRTAPPRHPLCSAAVTCQLFALSAPACSSGNGDGASGDCAALCNKIRSCDPSASDCLGECAEAIDEAMRTLQPPAAENYDACMQGVFAELDQIACADLEDRLDCFGNAVTLPGCEDPGWPAFADSTCAVATCDPDQVAGCVDFVVISVGQSVPCLNARGLAEVVDCTISCSPGVSNFECTTPG